MGFGRFGLVLFIRFFFYFLGFYLILFSEFERFFFLLSGWLSFGVWWI